MEDSPKSDTEVTSKSDLKFRETLYRMIISQLFYDGYQQVAVGLSGTLQVEHVCFFFN